MQEPDAQKDPGRRLTGPGGVTGEGEPGTGSVTGTPGVTSGGTVGTGATGVRANEESTEWDADTAQTGPEGTLQANDPDSGV